MDQTFIIAALFDDSILSFTRFASCIALIAVLLYALNWWIWQRHGVVNVSALQKLSSGENVPKRR